MSADCLHLAIIAGGVCRAAGGKASANPHRRGSTLARCWTHGFNRGTGRDEQVSRETEGVGRGRSALGPRSEWTQAELDDLASLAGEDVPANIIALLMDRSFAAVRGKLHRLKRAA